MTALLPRLKALAAQAFDTPPSGIPDDAPLNSLGGWTSLRHVTFMAALNKELGIRLVPQLMQPGLTLAKLADRFAAARPPSETPRFSERAWPDALRAAGVRRGDVVMLHSRVTAFGPVPGGLGALIEPLLEFLGPEGTLAMPAFTLSYGSTRKFDKETSPSEMGELTEEFRRLAGSRRSVHPFHSVSAIGRHAQEITGAWCASSFGRGSPYERLHELDAWHLCAGVGAEVLTFLHYVEEAVRVPYRAYKNFSGEVRADGRLDERTYSMYVRDLRLENNQPEWTGLLEELGEARYAELPYGRLHAYRSRTVFKSVGGILRSDPLALLAKESRPLVAGR